MKIPLVDLGLQHRKLATELERAMAGVLERGDFILGSEVADFEDEFARFCTAEHAVGVNSGTERSSR